MRFFLTAAAGMATLLCLSGLTNAGVVKRAFEDPEMGNADTDFPATAMTSWKLSHGSTEEAPEGSVDGQLANPQCCMPGCSICSPRTCFASDCSKNGLVCAFVSAGVNSY